MTRRELKTVELADEINLVIQKISLATMAILGWDREGARQEGISGLVNLLDEAHDDLLSVRAAIHSDTEERKAVENVAA